MEIKVAIYCRLSKEDEEKDRSESIKNQESSLLNYALERNWQVVDCYLDDGYSGTTFKRPEFRRLIRDIEKGLVNCILTKDYSRLGREHIQTSYYTEVFFPQHRVLYIAVNDGIDTQKTDDFLGIRAVFNDMYARDISKKIRYTLRNKQREGAFIGAFAPYGYKKDPNNNNKLLPDPLTVPIVQEIFQLYLAGCGKSRIATLLNKKGVPSPASVKSNHHCSQTTTYLWNPLAVKRILENEVYLGHTIQHKKEKLSYKIAKQITLPKEEWIKVENTHGPIIDCKTFKKVQEMIDKRKKSGYFTGKNPGLFSGIIKCGLCGNNYVYYNDKKYGRVLICSSYRRYYSRGCEKRILSEKEVEKILLDDLYNFLSRGINKEDLLCKILDNIKGKNAYIKEDLNYFKKKLRGIENKFTILYEDRLAGLLDEKQFLLFKEKIEKESSLLKERIENFNQIKMEENYLNKVRNLLDDFLNLDGLNRKIILKIIDRIEVVPPESFKVTYKFKPP